MTDMPGAESDAAAVTASATSKLANRLANSGAKLFFRRCENETEFRVSAVLVRVLIC